MSTHPLTYIKNKIFIIALGLLMALALVLAITVPSINAVFTSPINLSTNNAHVPVIDLDSAGVIHAAWVETTATGSDIWYEQSTDDGVNFGTNRTNLSSTASLISTNPQIKVDSADNIYIVWEEDVAVDGEPDIYEVKSSNGGTSFSARINISNDSLFSGSPYIETSTDNRIHVSWANETVGGDQLIQVYHSSSTDGGVTFSTPTNISNTSNNIDKPIVRARGDMVKAFWQAEGPDFGISRVRSTDNGVSFGTPLLISSSITIQATDHAIGIDQTNRVHMVSAEFTQPEGPEIFYSRSINAGVSFSSPVNLSNSATDISADPAILAVGLGTIHVIWSENTCDVNGCKKSIRIRTSTNGGASFAAATSPDDLQVLTSVESLDIDVFGVNLYMIWEQNGVIQFMKGN